MNKIILISFFLILSSCGGKPKADLVSYLEGGSRSYGTFDCFGTPDLCTRGVSITKKYIATSTSIGGLLTAKADPSKVLITLFDLNINDLNTPDSYVYLVDTNAFEKKYEHGFSALDVVEFIKSSQLIARTISGLSGSQGFDPSVGGYWKDDLGNYYFTEEKATSKDLESMGSRIESTEIEKIKESLLSFGLSGERTETLAKLALSYKKITNKRALSNFEKDQFTKELLGLTFEQASKEMVENYEGLIESVAKKNGTSPEAIKELINEYIAI